MIPLRESAHRANQRAGLSIRSSPRHSEGGPIRNPPGLLSRCCQSRSLGHRIPTLLAAEESLRSTVEMVQITLTGHTSPGVGTPAPRTPPLPRQQLRAITAIGRGENAA